MSLSNTARSYGTVTRSFHWLTALLIFTVIPLGLTANGLAHDINDPAVATTEADLARAAFLFSLHKTIGLTIFFLALARILWALTQTKPGLLNGEKRVEAWAAETVHWLLYGSLLLVPMTGWIHHAATTGFAPIWWPFGQTLPFVPQDADVAATFAGLHMVLERVLVAALFLHIAGALKHHFVDRDFTLRRMLSSGRDAPEPPQSRHSALPPATAVALWAVAIGIGAAIGAYDSHAARAPDAAQLADVQSDWEVQDGRLDIVVQQLGNPVTGSFADWTAAIQFEEIEQPGPAGSVDVTVAIGSLTLGSVTSQALGGDFFDAEMFPTANFAGEITLTEDGYVASGPLTIRGVTLPVELPFTLDVTEDVASMEGVLTLNRMDFGIGATSQPGESNLGFEVEVRVALSAQRSSE